MTTSATWRRGLRRTGVNVLELNLALDRIAQARAETGGGQYTLAHMRRSARLNRSSTWSLRSARAAQIYVGASGRSRQDLAMLEEAHELRDKGVDVVLASSKPTPRRHRAKLVTWKRSRAASSTTAACREDGVRRDPGAQTGGRGGRRMAHTNVAAPSMKSAIRTSRNCSRRESNVITAMNIQHVESLNPRSSGLTG